MRGPPRQYFAAGRCDACCRVGAHGSHPRESSARSSPLRVWDVRLARSNGRRELTATCQRNGKLDGVVAVKQQGAHPRPPALAGLAGGEQLAEMMP